MIEIPRRRSEGFSARCTKTCSGRYIKGKIYDSISRPDGYVIVDEDGGVCSAGKDFAEWYRKCRWSSYDFEEVLRDD